VLIPTVVNGRVVSEDAAVAHYRHTGEHLGIFRPPAEATAYAQSLHNDQAQEYGGQRPGVSFNDPIYGQLARHYEQQYGLPNGLLDAVRTRGERSNADQVSSAGAQSVYQFIPSTRQGFIRQHGIDPWAGPEQATEAAAIHLLTDYRSTGSWDEAVRRYYGGPRRSHTPTAEAYGRRVGSFDGR
jgi:soluble lytic murein transglycosylase-like protein